MSRVLHGGSGTHKTKKDQPSNGITDLSELAAVMDFYEVSQGWQTIRPGRFVRMGGRFSLIYRERFPGIEWVRREAFPNSDMIDPERSLQEHLEGLSLSRPRCFVVLPPRGLGLPAPLGGPTISSLSVKLCQLFCCFIVFHEGQMRNFPGDVVASQGGDVCEETGGRRSLKTAITCCAASQVADENYTFKPLAILVSIQVRLSGAPWCCGS